MPRERNPNRDKAKEIWLEHGGNITNRQIAEMLGENEKVVAVWKQRDKWNVVQQSETKVVQQTKRRKGGAPKGNKNALGNSGGPGGPSRNKKAVSTGEYETIWLDTLEEDEKVLFHQIETDPVKQLEQDIKLLDIRVRRMMQRISKLKDGLTDKQRRVLQERITKKDVIQVSDEKTGQSRTVPISRDELAVTQIEETEYRAIEDILKLEDALTRVQKEKLKAIELKHKLLVESDPEDEEGDGLESLAKAIDESKKLFAGEG